MTALPLLERLGAAFFKELPKTPGVYLLLGDDDKLLYVGKAKSLRTRLRSYTRVGEGDDERLITLVAQVRAIRWEELRSEAEAIARETELLRALRPPFNAAHTDRTEHRSIALTTKGDSFRFWVTDNPIGATEVYGCFPFSASVIDGYAALLTLLCLCQPGMTRLRVPAGVTRASGFTVTVDAGLQPPLRALLSGTGPRLVREMETRITASPGYDAIVGRAVARDAATLRRFYELGPRALRRLQRRQNAPVGAVSSEELTRLLAADLESELQATVHVDRGAIEQRIATMRDAGLAFGAIAERLNGDRVPKLRGGGRWTASAVAEVVGEQIARATRAPG